MTEASKHHEMPFVRIELAVLSLVESRLCVLLGKRTQEPYAGRWALPGGVLRIDADVDLEAAARRTALERLNVDLPVVRQLVAVGSKHRDKGRAPWALAVVYRALVPFDLFAPVAGKRLDGLRWVPVDDAATDTQIAFDHASLVGLAAAATRQEFEELRLPAELLPDTFTLGELQSLCEQVLGRPLDKSSFRRKLADRGLVEPVEGEVRGGANRPAKIYRAV